jgi:hypothetical protein
LFFLEDTFLNPSGYEPPHSRIIILKATSRTRHVNAQANHIHGSFRTRHTLRAHRGCSSESSPQNASHYNKPNLTAAMPSKPVVTRPLPSHVTLCCGSRRRQMMVYSGLIAHPQRSLPLLSAHLGAPWPCHDARKSPPRPNRVTCAYARRQTWLGGRCCRPLVGGGRPTSRWRADRTRHPRLSGGRASIVCGLSFELSGCAETARDDLYYCPLRTEHKPKCLTSVLGASAGARMHAHISHAHPPSRSDRREFRRGKGRGACRWRAATGRPGHGDAGTVGGRW